MYPFDIYLQYFMSSDLSFFIFLGHKNPKNEKFVKFDHPRSKRSSNGIQFIPYTIETRDLNIKSNLVQRGI